jgi:hypothetical protein
LGRATRRRREEKGKKEKEKKEKGKKKAPSDPDEDPEIVNDEFDSRGKDIFMDLDECQFQEKVEAVAEVEDLFKLLFHLQLEFSHHLQI